MNYYVTDKVISKNYNHHEVGCKIIINTLYNVLKLFWKLIIII
jgi:hypothetical protein